jgi:hypothetical protein
MKQPRQDYPDWEDSFYSSESPSDTPEKWSDLYSWRFLSSLASVFLFTSLPPGSWSRLSRATLLAAGIWYAGASALAEQLNSAGWLMPGIEYLQLRQSLLAAGNVFPLEDRYYKSLAYIAMQVGETVGMDYAIADLERALAVDPYGPDLLEGLAVFALKVGQQDKAQAAVDTLWRTEGCIDCWLRRQ